MHGLQAITHIWQRPRYDDTHRVIEVAVAHLIFDGNGGYINALGKIFIIGCQGAYLKFVSMLNI